MPGQKAPAGCFTQPAATQLCLAAVEAGIEQGWLAQPADKRSIEAELEGFLGRYGRHFYGLPEPSVSDRIVFHDRGQQIPAVIGTRQGEVPIACFGADKEILSLE